MVAHNCLEPQLQGVRCPPVIMGTCTHTLGTRTLKTINETKIKGTTIRHKTSVSINSHVMGLHYLGKQFQSIKSLQTGFKWL